MIDNLVEVIIMNLARTFESSDNDITACARIFQYVTKSIKYSEDLLNYECIIPFSSDYQFRCYNGIPYGNQLEDILITKEGTSFEIAGLMTFLGRVFNINIKTIIAMKDNEVYCINSFETDEKVSYLDPTGMILGNDESNCFLVDKTKLKEMGITLDSKNQNYDEGVSMTVDIKHASNVDKAISRERNNLSNRALSIKNNILNKEIEDNNKLK